MRAAMRHAAGTMRDWPRFLHCKERPITLAALIHGATQTKELGLAKAPRLQVGGGGSGRRLTSRVPQSKEMRCQCIKSHSRSPWNGPPFLLFHRATTPTYVRPTYKHGEIFIYVFVNASRYYILCASEKQKRAHLFAHRCRLWPSHLPYKLKTCALKCFLPQLVH